MAVNGDALRGFAARLGYAARRFRRDSGVSRDDPICTILVQPLLEVLDDIGVLSRTTVPTQVRDECALLVALASRAQPPGHKAQAAPVAKPVSSVPVQPLAGSGDGAKFPGAEAVGTPLTFSGPSAPSATPSSSTAATGSVPHKGRSAQLDASMAFSSGPIVAAKDFTITTGIQPSTDATPAVLPGGATSDQPRLSAPCAGHRDNDDEEAQAFSEECKKLADIVARGDREAYKVYRATGNSEVLEYYELLIQARGHKAPDPLAVS